MKSVIAQTQMLTQGCKVTHAHTEMTHQYTNGHTCVDILNMHVYPYTRQPPTDSSYTHVETHILMHILHMLKGYIIKTWVYTHTHTHTHFVRLQFPGVDTQHPRIQGPCLSTLVIMVNSWACYPIAAYGSLIALLGYIKTHDCTFRHVLRSLWSHTIFRPMTKASVFCLRSRDKNVVQFLSNTPVNN